MFTSDPFLQILHESPQWSAIVLLVLMVLIVFILLLVICAHQQTTKHIPVKVCNHRNSIITMSVNVNTIIFGAIVHLAHFISCITKIKATMFLHKQVPLLPFVPYVSIVSCLILMVATADLASWLGLVIVSLLG